MLDSDYKKFKQDTIKTINDLIQKVSDLQRQVSDIVVALASKDQNNKKDNYYPVQMSADVLGGGGEAVWLPHVEEEEEG